MAHSHFPATPNEKVPALFGCPCVWSHVPLYGDAQRRRRYHHALTKPDAPGIVMRLPSEIILCIVDALFDLYAREVSLGYEKYWESSCLPYETDMMCPFCMLPRFDVWRDVANLAATCRALYELVTPVLYRRDAERNHSSALLISAKRGNLRAVRLALENGADADADDHTMPLQWTNECFRYCEHCEYQVWWREPRRLDMGALHWAALCGRLDVLELLLRHGRDGRDGGGGGGGASPDKRATVQPGLEAGNFGSLRYVEDYCDEYNTSFPCVALQTTMGYDPISGEGANALYFLLGTSRLREPGETLAMARLLVEAGSSLLTHKSAGLHALHQAAAYDNVEVTRFLLGETKADPDVPDAAGNTPLHHHIDSRFRVEGAARDARTLAVLLGHGADPNRRNADGLSPLDLCLVTTLLGGDRMRLAAMLARNGATLRDRDLGLHAARLTGEQRGELNAAFREARIAGRSEWDGSI
ncbi:Tankyrase-1 [Colletotrichum tanaceti]|uniref:Tankyrase-1 n=1 Tax=Colletotrichum tanaceti TaxID=1306861 RepID=A0A4U6X0A0_9PEZI|nr:Tankyrase-1 [Colletotrichum tanaceti]TKW48802.1 Tankyrase-1 [Colletotrichum tanaceti]